MAIDSLGPLVPAVVDLDCTFEITMPAGSPEMIVWSGAAGGWSAHPAPPVASKVINDAAMTRDKTTESGRARLLAKTGISGEGIVAMCGL
jgi:hypothetical protein